MVDFTFIAILSHFGAVLYLSRVTSQSNSKKHIIFEHARSLFVRHGIWNTPTSRIAKAAGVSNGTLFHYFPTKDQLILELYIFLRLQLLESSLQNLDRIAGLRGMIRYVWTRRVKFLVENKTAFQFMRQFEVSPRHNDFSNPSVQAFEEKWISIIRQAQARGLLIDMPAELLVDIMYREIDAWVEYQHRNELNSSNELGQQVFHRFWKTIKPAES